MASTHDEGDAESSQARDGAISRRTLIRGAAVAAAATSAAAVGSALMAAPAGASTVATDLADVSGSVNISAAAAPVAGAQLVASSSTTASWMFPGITKQFNLNYTAASFFATTDQVIFPITNQNGSTFSGSFVANANGTGMIFASCNAISEGNAYTKMLLFVGGANQALPLYSATGAAATGASIYPMGQIWYDSGGTAMTIQYLSGLTAGATYNWQMCGALTNPNPYENPVSNQPSGVAVRSHLTNLIDMGYVTCYNAASGGAQVIPFLLGGRGYGNTGQAAYDQGSTDYLPGNFAPYGSTFDSAVPSTTLTNPTAVAFTPNGTTAVAVGAGSNVINVINPSTNTLTAAYTISGATAFESVVCDNTYAYLSDNAGGYIYQVTLSSGATNAKSASITGPQRIGLTPSGSQLVVPTSVGTVMILTTSTMATAQTVSLVGLSGGSGTITNTTVVQSAKVTPSGTTAWAVVSTSTNASLVSINLSTYAATAYSLPHPGPAGTDLAIAPTGNQAIIAFAGGAVTRVWITGTYLGDTAVDNASALGGASGLALTNDAHVYVATGSDGHVVEFPNATFYITIEGFYGGACSVLVLGAAS